MLVMKQILPNPYLQPGDVEGIYKNLLMRSFVEHTPALLITDAFVIVLLGHRCSFEGQVDTQRDFFSIVLFMQSCLDDSLNYIFLIEHIFNFF